MSIVYIYVCIYHSPGIYKQLTYLLLKKPTYVLRLYTKRIIFTLYRIKVPKKEKNRVEDHTFFTSHRLELSFRFTNVRVRNRKLSGPKLRKETTYHPHSQKDSESSHNTLTSLQYVHFMTSCRGSVLHSRTLIKPHVL